MKKFNLLLLTLAICSSVFSQNQTQKLNWKVGDSKDISVKFSVKQTENNTLAMDSTFTYEGVFNVEKETDEDYYASMNESNMLVEIGKTYYKNLPKEVTVKSFKSDISVDKNELTITQTNQEEYNVAVQKSHDEILKILAEKAPEKLAEAKQNIEETTTGIQQRSITSQIFELILDTYQYNYSKTDTLFSDPNGSNPVKMQNAEALKVMTYVQPSNKKGTIDVVIERIYDLDLYKNMLSQLSQTTTAISGLAGDDDSSDVQNQMEEAFNQMMGSMKFDTTDKTIVNKKEGAGWPNKIDKLTTIGMNMGGSKTEAIISINVQIE